MSNSPPASLLLLGSGTFSLSTVLHLLSTPHFSQTKFTLLTPSLTIPVPLTASADSSRIIRADYSDPFYTTLAERAQQFWRSSSSSSSPDPSHPFHGVGNHGRYNETGMLLTTDRPPSDTSDYVDKSLLSLPDSQRERIQIVDAAEIKKLTGSAGGAASGRRGYVNPSSGWADAEASVAWAWEKVLASGRVEVVEGIAERVEDNGTVILKDGRALKSEVVVVAVGSWCTELGGVREKLNGRVKKTGQALGFVVFEDEGEWERSGCRDWGVHFNVSDGELHISVPSKRTLKLAIHLLHGLPTVSAAQSALSAQARRLLPNYPHLKVTGARLCPYGDTRNGDFIADWIPGMKNVFMLGGDSGHGFKFLPVLGEEVVRILMGEETEAAGKWRWPEEVPEGRWGGDGSRGSGQGMGVEEGAERAMEEAERVVDEA